jgi:exonuclease III
MKKALPIVFILISIYSFSQTTIKLMYYNLLNFNNYTSYCDQTNNSHVAKAGYLKTIVQNQEPDLLAVCELGTSPSVTYTINYILGNSLNVGGETKWAATNTSSSSYLANGLFYDKNKFEYIGHEVVATGIRDINIYKLKYIENGENILMNIVVLHLKAGNSSSDASQRGEMVDYLMTRIRNLGNSNENFIVTGDFNVYTSNETAFQKLINPNDIQYTFYDPINQIGAWGNNYTFREHHTQSTHLDDNDCHSYGGMNDRFDFILIAGSIKDGSANIKYKTDSYKAVGQDGLRFNKSLISPSNTSLPQEVITALYEMSDHLPVVAEFYMGEQNSSISLTTDPQFYANVVNPIDDKLVFKLQTIYKNKIINLRLMNISGAIVYETQILTQTDQIYSYDMTGLSKGVYILNFNGEGINQSVKLVKTE